MSMDATKYKPYPAYKESGVEWLGEVPAHWEVKRVKHIAEIQLSNIDKLSVEGQPPVQLCNYLDVYKNDKITSSISFMQATASLEQIRRLSLKKADVLLTKDSETPDDIGIPAVVSEELNGVVCGYHLALLRPYKDLFNGFFLMRAIQSPETRAYFEVEAVGMTRFGIGKQAIASTPVLVPPLKEQQTIAAFLDRETAKIDTLIAKQERLIELLGEKRTALISHAVTKGLNPDAPMKDSGVEWLGEVPEHWKIKALKWETPILRGASPRPIDDPIYFDDDGDYAWVRISDVTAAGMYLTQTEQRLSKLGSSLSVKLEPGAFFLSIAGSVGKPCITNIRCCIHDGFVYFPWWKGDNKFLFYLFASGEPYKGLGKWGTQLNLNTDTVGSIVIGVPSHQEQFAIAAFLDRETAKIDTLITKARRALDLLKERRTALVSAAVTGKIDVRDAA